MESIEFAQRKSEQRLRKAHMNEIKPVYEEYRKIGYRLKKQRQTTIFDYLEEEKND